MGHHRSKRSGHGLHVTSSDLPINPTPSDSGGGGGGGGGQIRVPPPPQNPALVGVDGGVTTHPEVTAGSSDLVDSRRSHEKGQPVNSFRANVSHVAQELSLVANLTSHSALPQQPPAQPTGDFKDVEESSDPSVPLQYLVQTQGGTRTASERSPSASLPPGPSHTSPLLSRPSLLSSPSLFPVPLTGASLHPASPFSSHYLNATASRTQQEKGDEVSAHPHPPVPDVVRETATLTPRLPHTATLRNPITSSTTTTGTTEPASTTTTTTTSRKATHPTTHSTRGHRRLTTRSQRSAPTQKQVMQSHQPHDLDGVCKDDPCGQEASCHPTAEPPRNFTCYCDDKSEVEPGSSCPSRGQVLSEHPSPKTLITREPVHVVWVVGLASVLVLALLLLTYWRRKSLCVLMRDRHREKSGPQSPDAVVKNNSLVAYNFASNPNYYTQGPDTQTVHTLPVHLIHPEQISFIGELGEGCFGKVYKGTYGPQCPENIRRPGDEEEDGGGEGEGEMGGDDGGGGGGEEIVTLTVAVKVIKDSVGAEGEEDFMREVEIMSAFTHPNILALVGIVAKGSGGTPWMVFEFMPYGDLAELLRSCGPHFYSNHTPATSLSKDDLLHISVQIASGMEYLSSQHFVHRDLACRNCLVGENLTVKISDFGMSRDVYTCDYYKVGGSRMLPVRWMAPESVMYGKFTLESDVWSFGVVLWEIYSFGKQPYYGNSNENVVKLIIQGILLSPPDTCPPQVCAIMRRCWATDPTDRLKFPEILAHLKGLQGEGKDAPHHSTCLQQSFGSPCAPVTYSQLCMQEEGGGHLDKDLYLVPRRAEPREYLTILNDV